VSRNEPFRRLAGRTAKTPNGITSTVVFSDGYSCAQKTLVRVPHFSNLQAPSITEQTPDGSNEQLFGVNEQIRHSGQSDYGDVASGFPFGGNNARPDTNT
jgi:hypothetical protein